MISKQDPSLIIGIVGIGVLGGVLVWQHNNHSYTSNEVGGVAQVRGRKAEASDSRQRDEMAENSKNPVEIPTAGGSSGTNMSSHDSSGGEVQNGVEHTSGTSGSGAETQGEKKLTGCIVDKAGTHMLEDADGHFYLLNNSERFSIHAGEEVVVHGTIGNSGSLLTLPSDGGPRSTVLEISATKIEMVSGTCKLVRNPRSGKGKQAGETLLPN
jgi:hypothetical protein